MTIDKSMRRIGATQHPHAIPRLSVLVLALGAMVSTPAWSQSADSLPTGRVIVRFKAEAQSVRAQPLAARSRSYQAQEVARNRGLALGLRQGQSLAARRSLDERTHVYTALGLSSAALAQRLARDPEVEFVAVDHKRYAQAVPNDPMFGSPDNKTFLNGKTPSGADLWGRTIDQWYLQPPSSTPGEVVSSVNAVKAWDTSKGLTSIVVAVLDTGVRYDHPDLAGKLLPGYDMIGVSTPGAQSSAIANDGDGADADANDPGDWVSQADVDAGQLGSDCTSSSISNSSWHGTRVAGIIGAATNNGRGIAGVSWNSPILPVRVLGKCGGYDSDIMAGMKWAAGIAVPGLPTNPNPARVLNLSLGGSGSCSDSSSTASLYRSTIDAVNAKGAVIVAAAGNSAGKAVGLPGNCSGVLSVAALRHVGTKVGFSSVGPEVGISAPGGNCINIESGTPCLYPMLSTTNKGTRSPHLNEEAYTDSSASVGTSFATPVVAGVAALMLSVQPTLTPAEIRSLLRSTARPFVGSGGTAGVPQCTAPTAAEQDECYCTTSTCGAGMTDAAAAVAAVAALPTPAPTPTPTPTPSPVPSPTPAPSSGGGGAMGGEWLLGLLATSAVLRARRRDRADRPD